MKVTTMTALQNIGVKPSLFTDFLIQILEKLSIERKVAEYFLEPAIRNMTIENQPADLDNVSAHCFHSICGETDHKPIAVIAQLKTGQFVGSNLKTGSFKKILEICEAKEEDIFVLAVYYLGLNEKDREDINTIKVYPYLSPSAVKKLRRKVVDRVFKVPQSQLLMIAAEMEVN